ncbi:unnamed protein product [Cladocopium goreaui]|uniref:Reticulocyte-binding protein 2-like a n=1 Tax=Cladocopium goreaui TaxID=2562237 RepID=A0A9P1DMZ9_9DINO|nr:unnamed protein product [Cladocopium goreaui]|mmetsp:Transcript_37440/g.76473  ORF Transcript_37440/g.76473 Transcript_37440/m.76473 type:complete len:285 (-) Transcript_37440:36-890(-)
MSTLETTKEWMEQRLKQLHSRCRDMQAKVEKQNQELGAAQETALQFRRAQETIQADIAEEKHQSSVAQRRQMEEFKALHSARNREEQLKSEKRQICQEMEVAKQQIQEEMAEAERLERQQEEQRRTLRRQRQALREQEKYLEELEAVKVKFLQEAKEEKTRRQELREKMRAWLQREEMEIEELKEKLSSGIPREMAVLEERLEASRQEAVEADLEAERLMQKTEDFRELIPVYTEQRRELLEQIRDMTEEDARNRDELLRGQSLLLEKQVKAQERARRLAAGGS